MISSLSTICKYVCVNFNHGIFKPQRTHRVNVCMCVFCNIVSKHNSVFVVIYIFIHSLVNDSQPCLLTAKPLPSPLLLAILHYIPKKAIGHSPYTMSHCRLDSSPNEITCVCTHKHLSVHMFMTHAMLN